MAGRTREKEAALSLEQARSLLSYNPETGELAWKRPPRRGVAAGPAGCVNPDGYLIVGYRGHLYLATHLIWFLMTGEWPEHGVDHENRNTSDDRWENLRAATYTQNNRNRGVRKDNKTGVRGVIAPQRTSRYEARIRVDGKEIRLGRFDHLADAAAARRDAEMKYFGEFAPMSGGQNG